MKFLSYILFIDKIWGEKVSANNWLLPLSVLAAALSGVVFGGGMVFQSVSNTTLIGVGGSLIMIWGYNLAESIIASSTPLVAFGRSVLTLVTIVAVFVLSCVASVVVLVVIALLLVAFIMLFFASKGLFGEGGKTFTLNNGDKVTKNDGLFGDDRYYSTTGSGKAYTSSDENTFREE